MRIFNLIVISCLLYMVCGMRVNCGSDCQVESDTCIAQESADWSDSQCGDCCSPSEGSCSYSQYPLEERVEHPDCFNFIPLPGYIPPEGFDCQCYLNRYPDLKKWTNGDCDKAEKHWNDHGKDATRDATCHTTCTRTCIKGCVDDYNLQGCPDYSSEEDSGSVTMGLTDTDLQCTCEEYDCTCRKECFCQVIDQSDEDKSNSFLETDASVSSSASTSSGHSAHSQLSGDDEDEEPAMFRCGCDFGGADVAMTEDQGLECDCSVARCECTKKCTCTEQESASSLSQMTSTARYHSAPKTESATSVSSFSTFSSKSDSTVASSVSTSPSATPSVARTQDIKFDISEGNQALNKQENQGMKTKDEPINFSIGGDLNLDLGR